MNLCHEEAGGLGGEGGVGDLGAAEVLRVHAHRHQPVPQIISQRDAQSAARSFAKRPHHALLRQHQRVIAPAGAMRTSDPPNTSPAPSRVGTSRLSLSPSPSLQWIPQPHTHSTPP